MTLEEEQYHLTTIANSINEIEAYTQGMDYDDFMASEDIRTSVARNIHMVGEAANMLSSNDDWLNKYEELDLHVLSTLRYANYNEQLEMDAHGLWDIIENDMPIIKDKVFTITSRLEREASYKDDLRG
jgi:uncharacterized protein with HEPN domain